MNAEKSQRRKILSAASLRSLRLCGKQLSAWDAEFDQQLAEIAGCLRERDLGPRQLRVPGLFPFQGKVATVTGLVQFCYKFAEGYLSLAQQTVSPVLLAILHMGVIGVGGNVPRGFGRRLKGLAAGMRIVPRFFKR